MTHFLDGPAKGEILYLRRAPMFLRVTRDPMCNFDGLDQVDDTPQPEETIFVYRRKGNSSIVHVDGRRDGKRWSGWYEFGQYELDPEQPAEAVMRDNTAWQKWAQERAASLTETK